MRRYENYKPSGVKWLGDVPAHWEILPFKGLFRMSTEKNGKAVVGEMLSVSGYRGIEVKPYEFEAQKRSEAELRDYRVVRPGQLVVNTMWLNHTGLGVSEYEGHVSPAYRSYWFAPQLRARYVHYLMRSHSYVQGYTGQMQGIRPNSLQIKNSDFTKIPILVPPQEEQDQIVAFLDQKAAEIDAAIAKKERLIELLCEQKELLVSQAVLTGLNSGASTKPCEIDGIGEIPSHWGVVANRHLFREKAKKYKGEDLPPLSLSQKDGLVPTDEMKERSLKTSSYEHFKICRAGDLVLNRFKAHLGVFFAAKQDGVVTFHYGIYTPERGVSSKYFELLFHTNAFRAIYAGASNGMTVGLQNLSNQSFYDVKSICPPLDEQIEIVNHVINLEVRYAALILFIDRELASLRELKKLVVANAVTGKIKV